MKRVLALAAGLSLFLTVLAGPAAAARSQAAYASITSVVPHYVTSGTDDCGDYCEYQALVTLSWNGTVRLWVSHYVNGTRSAPTEVRLTGSGKDVTLMVTGIRAEPTTAPLLAEVFALSKRSWALVTTYQSDPITCTAVSV